VSGRVSLDSRSLASTATQLYFSLRATPNSLTRNQTDKFTFKGEGEETFIPQFTYHGYRYVQVEGLAYQPTNDTLMGYFVHTDMSQTGHVSFNKSYEILNRIQKVREEEKWSRSTSDAIDKR
jgi:alpha-L-rhamnosidase